jgi:ABC-2 type transport system ATP-binding protein
MDYAIEAEGLGKRYGRRWALADCTLTVPAGQVAGLVGPNGAGKTTFLELAAGLLRPTTGTIRVRESAAAPRAPAATVTCRRRRR